MFYRGTSLCDRRHFIFYSPNMIDLLSRAKEWYCNGTFKSVGALFTQLWSIHIFLREGDAIKQVPLLFVVMSGKSVSDYVAILQRFKNNMLNNPVVGHLIMDFEFGTLSAMRQKFPQAQGYGCNFHWCQAIWKRVRSLGLAPSYMNHANTHNFIRRLLCLPFCLLNILHQFSDPCRQLTHPRRQWLSQLLNF